MTQTQRRLDEVFTLSSFVCLHSLLCVSNFLLYGPIVVILAHNLAPADQNGRVAQFKDAYVNTIFIVLEVVKREFILIFV